MGGTDKMAQHGVGTVRTYARFAPTSAFTYDAWKEAVRRVQTFVTYGPLMEFEVEGKPAGTKMQMSATGGTVNVGWKLASVTVPMSRVELVVNGEVRESQAVRPDEDGGCWTVKVDRKPLAGPVGPWQVPGQARDDCRSLVAGDGRGGGYALHGGGGRGDDP